MLASRLSIAALFPAILFLAGLVQNWRYRHFIYPDGQQYLDVARQILSGDAAALANPIWSPAYPLLLAAVLAPVTDQPYWWYPAMQLVNAVCYAIAIWQFHLFILAANSAQTHRAPDRQDGLAVMAAGYAAFTLIVLYLLNVRTMTPDMLVAAVTLFVGRRLIEPSESWETRWALQVGSALAIGYYVKAVLLPVAIVLLAVLAIASLRDARRRRIIAIAAIVLAAGVAPLVVATSARAGKPTFGESGRIVYGWWVQGQPFLLESARAADGAVFERVCAEADVYRWSFPAKVAYPPFYEPSYWRADHAVPLSVPAQLHAAPRIAEEVLSIGRDALLPLLPGLALLLIAAGMPERGHARRYAWVWLLSVAGIAIYLPVHIETRFVAAPLLMIVTTLVAGIAGRVSTRTLAVSIALVWLGAIAMSAPTALGAVRQTYFDVRDGEGRAPSEDWRVARALTTAGLAPGAPIAIIGNGFVTAWAQLARVSIVAQAVPPVQPVPDDQNWVSRAVQCLSRTDAEAIVGPAGMMGALASPLGDTSFAVLRLRR